MTNKKSLDSKSQNKEVYRTDLPQGQDGIPAPPKFVNEIESFGFDLNWRPSSYFQNHTLEQKLGSKIKGQIRGKHATRQDPSKFSCVKLYKSLADQTMCYSLAEKRFVKSLKRAVAFREETPGAPPSV